MALKGLSSPESSRRGNIFGILGMVIAVGTLILQPNSSNFYFLLSAILIGGLIGSILGLKIKMTAMPQLVAAFHSLVGLAAVLVAAGAFLAPEKFNILSGDKIKLISAIEMSVGLVVGAITFSGSIIAFGKLQGIMTGNPIVFKFQHILNFFTSRTNFSFNLSFCCQSRNKYFYYSCYFILCNWYFNYYPYWWS